MFGLAWLFVTAVSCNLGFCDDGDITEAIYAGKAGDMDRPEYIAFLRFVEMLNRSTENDIRLNNNIRSYPDNLELPTAILNKIQSEMREVFTDSKNGFMEESITLTMVPMDNQNFGMHHGDISCYSIPTWPNPHQVAPSKLRFQIPARFPTQYNNDDTLLESETMMYIHMGNEHSAPQVPKMSTQGSPDSETFVDYVKFCRTEINNLASNWVDVGKARRIFATNRTINIDLCFSKLEQLGIKIPGSVTMEALVPFGKKRAVIRPDMKGLSRKRRNTIGKFTSSSLARKIIKRFANGCELRTYEWDFQNGRVAKVLNDNPDLKRTVNIGGTPIGAYSISFCVPADNHACTGTYEEYMNEIENETKSDFTDLRASHRENKFPTLFSGELSNPQFHLTESLRALLLEKGVSTGCCIPAELADVIVSRTGNTVSYLKDATAQSCTCYHSMDIGG